MSVLVRVAACLIGCGMLGAVGSAVAQEEEPPAASGRALYLQYCSACHGMEGKGDGPVAQALKEKPADLTQLAATRGGVFPRPALQRIIDGRDVAVAHGTREMPVWGQRFGEALPPGTAAETVRRGTTQLLVDYLATIQVAAPEAAPE